MHKKLFTAVLALGLLLVFSPVFASDTPNESPVKTFGVQSKTGTPVRGASIADPVVTVNAGQNRTVPGTFCDGQYQGPLTYGINGWYAGNEFYAGYQDPADPTRFGAVCANSPSFDVTAVNTIIGNTAGPFPFAMTIQPLIFPVASPSATAGCLQEPGAIAGGVSCAGPAYVVTWNTGGFFLLNLPFSLECCQAGAYYAAWYSGTAGPVRIGTDGGFAGGDHAVDGQNFCSQWNEYGAGWLDMDQFWEANFGPGEDLTNLTWSEGYTPDDPATHCTPGACAYSFNYICDAAATSTCAVPGSATRFEDGNDDWYTGFLIRDVATAAVAGALKWGVRFDAIGLDTLKEFKFLIYDGFTGAAGPDDLEVEIWDQGPATGCGGEKVPGTLLYSVAIPAASVVYYPLMNTIPMPDITFGTLNGGPEASLFATVRVVSGVTGSCMGYPTTPTGGGCISTPFRPRSLLWYPNWLGTLGDAQWKYTGERTATAGHFEFWMEGLICREVLPAIEAECGAGGPDEWTSFAHDNRQTSASSINVGDPQEVTLAWTLALPKVSNFTNPTVANDIIYISSDQELNAYDLATNAPVGTLAGAPEMGSSNRGNATVAYIAALGRDVVFATAGNFNGITALETNLETSPKIWSNNVLNFNPPNGFGVGQQNRFNTSRVVDVAGTDVLYVCTEPAAGTGLIYAFDAATGALYPGWVTNPVVLDAAAKHGPAVNGGKLYVGTAIGGSNVDGSLYQIDAATGAVDWTFVGGNDPSEGWPGGVSTEGDFVYGATADANNVGVRYKIDVSGAVPSVVWNTVQGRGLYGTPTIGSSFVYFPLDNPNFGILQVDKNIGTVARNFVSSSICDVSVGMIPQHLTLSCDAFLFAGDRQARWWLFDAQTGDAMWYREFPVFNGGEIVSGTALVSHSSGADYAVVAVRQLGGTVGQISAYRLNAGPRPRLIQCVHDETVIVPLGAGPGNPHSVADVFMNIGTAPLNFTALNITDPLPDGMATASRNVREYNARIASAASDFDGYNSIATSSSLTKKHRMAGLSADMVDGEFSTTQVELMNSQIVDLRSNARSMAAGASMIRTSGVLVGGAGVPGASIAPAGIAGLDWIWDGTGLGRGQDANDLEFDMNDPDFNYDGSPVATFHILYQGGCVFAQDTVNFNTNGSYETVFNHGALGDDGVDEWNFGADVTGPAADLFDGTLIIAGDSVAGGLAPDYGAQLFMDMFGNQTRFVPNVAPVSGVCGFDDYLGLTLGAKRTGGCPGTPVDIHGEKVVVSFSDTNFAATPGTPGAAIGLDIVMTEVGTLDPLYGDFKLIRWEFTNRDAVAKGPLHAGTYFDWDVNAGTNNGIVSDLFNGYAVWNRPVGTIAYGMLNPNMPHTYAGVDPSFDSPHKIWVLSNPTEVYDPAPWDMANDAKLQTVWSQLVHGGAREVHGPATNEDKSALLVNKAFNLAPNGTHAIHQAVFGVDASSDVPATIEANAAALAARAARWAGFARGDVNDDGLVDLADVCWLQGGNYIYPAAYSGDVNADGLNDAADIARLLSYVSGNAGDQPVAAWRF